MADVLPNKKVVDRSFCNISKQRHDIKLLQKQ